jgi:hypothetical protein
MKNRILVMLAVAALMVVMLAFSVATAAIAQGEQGREIACGKILETPASGNVPFCVTT